MEDVWRKIEQNILYFHGLMKKKFLPGKHIRVSEIDKVDEDLSLETRHYVNV